ncbi:DUF86 domain-containing protein [Lentisphaera marina]|uniref:HepT-like ribonuclease domain-containing protein n=1 Tax=Lentisphaera marina TaxID=1111041 RepID=UPI0023656A2D|nr:HepT-like ribonuclease domain-containing protein [Lentisphaera marina]MDD7984257.1 DUF86 domain-containing protein [Lentisphaera marina]
MENKVKKWLFDAAEAANNIKTFCEAKTFNEYDQSLMLQSAVERQFEILGEALRRIREIDPQTIDSIPGSREAISFRNMLAHEYGHIDDRIVWSIVVNELPALSQKITDLLK